MATTATPWAGQSAHKLYLQSGQFTSTIKDSEDVSSLAPSLAIGICWDSVDTPWSSDYANKLYLQSGQFTSTLKTSQDISGIDSAIVSISADDNNTPWAGSDADKLYLTSGQFTSTIKDSEAIGSIELNVHGISYDGKNTPWIGHEADKLYLQSGQFTSTLKTSQDVSGVSTSRDISTNDYHSRVTILDHLVTDSLTIGDSISEEIIRVPFPIQHTSNALTISDGVLGILDSINIVDNLIITDQVEPSFNVFDVVDNLVITDSVYQPITYDMNITDNIIVSDAITFSHNVYNIVDNLTITQYIDVALEGAIEKVASNNLVIVDSATAEITSYAPKIIDNLPINDDIEVWYPYHIKLQNGILFTQEVHVGMKYIESFENNLVDDHVFWNPGTGRFETVSYGLGHKVVSQLIGNHAVVSDLNLSHDVKYIYISVSAIAKSLSNTLNLGQAVIVSRGLEHTLNLSQMVNAVTCYNLSSTLNLTQSVALIKTLKLGFTHTFTVESTFSHTFNETEILCKYNPFVGHTTDAGAPTPPSITQPTITPIDEITLSCPSKSTSITLRNPDLNDRDTLQYSRINRETRGGTLIIFADSTWPRIEKLILEFSGLSETKAQELLTFLNTSLGLTVTLTDWENRSWSGIITKPQNPIIREGRDCGVSASIEFEGVPT